MSMDITPPHLRCGMGSCPSVHVLEDGDYTPEHLRCVAGASCPSVSGYHGRLVIVGRKADGIANELGLGVGPDEAVIEIGEEYFSDLPELVHLRSQVASLREALEPFSYFIHANPCNDRADNELAFLSRGLELNKLTFGDFRRARAVLEALDCQAHVTDKGPVPSPSALQKSAGEDALLPCPFCGGSAETYGSNMVMCSDTVNCGANIDFGHWTGTNDDGTPAIHYVIEQWNKRRPPDTEDETPGGSQNPVSEPLP